MFPMLGLLGYSDCYSQDGHHSESQVNLHPLIAGAVQMLGLVNTYKPTDKVRLAACPRYTRQMVPKRGQLEILGVLEQGTCGIPSRQYKDTRRAGQGTCSLVLSQYTHTVLWFASE